MSSVKIWIDCDTGTWGAGLSLVSIEVDATDEQSFDRLLESLDNMSEDERCEYGRTYGQALFK